METTGLDGGNSTMSAPAIASRTPGAGLACSAPTGTTASAGTEARSRTQYSWKWIALRSPSSSTATCVSTRSSVIGMSFTPGFQRSHSASVTALSGYPAAIIWVRTMWVAKSRSPSPNHSGPTPYAASSSLRWKVSSARPQPCSSLMPPPRVYITVSRSGQTFSPKRWMSSPVLPMTVMSASGAARFRPRRNRAPPMPPARTTMRMGASMAGGYDNASGGHATRAASAVHRVCIGISVRPG